MFPIVSDPAVTVTIPTSVPAGIAWRTLGDLVLTRGDVNCADYVHIRFFPPSILLYSRQTASDHDWQFGGSYSKDQVLTSPALPPRAEPFGIGATGGSHVVVGWEWWNLEVSDGDPSFSITSGPSFTANNERTLTVRVTDDWAWDYTITADFYIVQPTDEVVISEWTVV